MLAPPKPRPPPHRSLCLRITFSCCALVTLAFLGLIAAEAAAGGKPSCEHPMLTFIDAKAQRHLPAPVAPAATASWPRKGFDLNRTSSSPRAAARDLSAPAWSFFVGSVTYATPVIDATGNIFVASTCGAIICISPEGRVLWTYHMGSVYPSSPVLLQGSLFVSDGAGNVYALDAATGHPRWIRQFAGSRGTSDAFSLAGDEGILVATTWSGEPGAPTDGATGGQLRALAPRTGEDLWVHELPSSTYNHMPIVTSRAVIYSDTEGALWCLDRSSGARLWSTPPITLPQTGPASLPAQHDGSYHDLADSLGGTSISHGGLIYVTGNADWYTGVARAYRETSLELAWEHTFPELSLVANAAALSTIAGVPTLVLGVGLTPPLGLSYLLHPGSPEDSDGYARFDGTYRGRVVALHATTGAALWTFDTPRYNGWMAAGQRPAWRGLPARINIPDSFASPMVGADGVVYISYANGVLYALNGTDGSLISSFQGESAQAEPAVGPHGELVVMMGTTLQVFKDP